MHKSNGDDERRGLPSASSWQRYSLCRASYQLEKRAAELGQLAHQGGEAATRGEMIHAWLAGEKVALSPADLATANFLKERSREQIKRIFPESNASIVYEKRVWLSQG